MSEPLAPESGPLSFEDAVASLVTPPEPEQQPEPQPEAPPKEAAETAEEPQGETSSPEEAAEGAENPEEGEEAAETPEPEKLSAPLYWKPEAKAVFDAMTPEQQAVVLAQEGPREEATAKAKAEAAKVREAADAELSKVQQLAAALDERLPQWIETFTSKWGAKEPDWVALAQEHGAESVSLAKMQCDAEKARLQDAANETAKAKQLAHEQFVKTEFAKLAELAPELAPSISDPAQGAEKRQAVTKYLVENGIPNHAIAQISAVEMTIARKAMLYDQLQAQAAQKPKPKPAAPAPKATVRPSASAPQSSSDRTATQIANRFAQTRSVDDAVALLLAKG